MMQTLYLAICIFLFINLIVGLKRTSQGPTAADRLVTAQFFTTKAVAILLLLAHILNAPSLRDIALVFVLLAVIVTIAFVRLQTRSLS